MSLAIAVLLFRFYFSTARAAPLRADAARFMSKKFTYAQKHYAVHKLEALLKWEDKLIGRKVHVITDHKALEFFKTQALKCIAAKQI